MALLGESPQDCRHDKFFDIILKICYHSRIRKDIVARMRVHSFEGDCMKKNISRKREREEADSQDGQERDLHGLSEVHVVNPVENQHFEQQVESTVEQVTFPEYLERFLYQNTRMFNDLINLSSPGSLVDYLDANRVCNTYFKGLYDALDAVLNLTQSRYAQIVSTSKVEDEDIKSIDFGHLIAILRESKSAVDQKLVKKLNEGIETWRLPMIAHLYNSAHRYDSNNTMQALFWLEKRRAFIQSSIKQDPKLMDWLNEDNQAGMKKILEKFTQSIFKLLSKERIFQFIDEDEGVIYPIKLPELIDVRKLWYTLYLNNLYSEDDNAQNSQKILNHSQYKQSDFEIFLGYQNAFPSPFVSFVDAFSGLQSSERAVDNMPVTGDVLIWLLVAQRDNAELAREIIQWSTEVDKVVRAYVNHNKQINRQERSNLLAKSMATTLQAIHNSPSKLRQHEEGQLKKLSPVKSPRIESEVKDESPARKIKL